jgi:hypothetical protein
VAQKLWFVYSDDVVNGPFNTETLKQQLTDRKWSETCFIWWKGQREWIPVATWQKNLDSIVNANEDKAHSPIWYIDNGTGSPVGPLTKEEMYQHLRGFNTVGKVRLWTAGMQHWTPLFDLPDIIDDLGMSRREHNRAPLMGSVAITSVSGTASTIIARAACISVGGCGLNDAQMLNYGDEVQLVIKSAEFPNPIRMQALVMYVTSSGYAGLKFHQVHSETHALIFDYVKKFVDASGGSHQRKSA